jgi:hypothetical protein
MENQSTPKPESEEYDVNHPQNINMPEFNSSTDKREGAKLPAIENMNDEDEKVKPEDSNRSNLPQANLGNEADEDEEKEDERIIRR